jgi:hypothetical protein
MGRRYEVTSTNVSVSAVQDLISLYATSAMAFKLVGFVIAQVTSTTAQMLRFRVIRLPATFTVGSGGSAPTPSKALKGDAAATVTARANDTVQATTNATAAVLHSDVMNSAVGAQFFWPKDDQPTIGLSDGMALSLDTAPSPTLSMSVTFIFEEIL